MVQAAMPGSRLEIFDDAGHFPHHTDPDRFARLVTEFVAGTNPATFERDRWRQRLLRGTTPESASPATPAASPPAQGARKVPSPSRPLSALQ
jgi:hypothetical protein